MTITEKIRKNLGEEWFEFLPKAESFLEPVFARLSEEKQLIRIYPEPKDVFKAFRLCSPSNTKVVWLGQDPYHWPPGQATGLAFECGKMVSPSWRKIAEIYTLSGYSDSSVINGRLQKWADQGVLLLNLALTVREKIPQSHIQLWDSFSRYAISSLMTDLKPKGFVILGEKARQKVPRVGSPHKGFFYEHPAAASYQQRQWNARTIFNEINEFLNFQGYKINW